MTSTSKAGIFTIVFGIACAVIYAVCTEVNLPVFTYHPATGEFGLFYDAPRRGPAMFWFGWILTAALGAAALAAIATFVPEPWLQRIVMVGVIGAVLYLIIYTVALFTYERASIELEFLTERWWSAALAAVVAVVFTAFAPAAWTRRLWPNWTVIVPVGVIVVMVYYLTPYFTR